MVERTTTIRGSHFYNHMFRLCSVSFLLFPYYAGAPRAPLFPLLCRHIVRLPSSVYRDNMQQSNEYDADMLQPNQQDLGLNQ